MPLVRMLVTWKDAISTPGKDAMSNTLYFNVTGVTPIDPTGYQNLVNDLHAIYLSKPWIGGRRLNVRAYDMADAEPRPIKAQSNGTGPGGLIQGPHQVALCLSYYADRNLNGTRGRIYVGPFQPASTDGQFATAAQMTSVMGMAAQLADLGGANVDWSLYSPSRQDATRINHAWVDNSWDIIRSRKLAGTSRQTWQGDG